MRLREIKPGNAILCENKEQGDAVKEQLLKQGASWSGNRNASYSDIDRICYMNSEGQYSFCSAYIATIKFSDLIITELSPVETLKICNEICCNAGACKDCEMADNCFGERDSDFQKVVEICEQWKSDHEKKEPEKKEPEVEWVDICRIIQVHGGGKKKCVHEIELYEPVKEVQAEEAYKAFVSTHEGNYIAVVEHVCRVKKEV